PGRIRNGDTADRACDHYHRWEGDVEWLARLGVRAYRFSLSWSRILPEGRGRVNPAGLAFYDRLVDRLLEKDILPFVTVHHWDFPAALGDLGGWTVRESADWFADYAEVVFRALGDRVRDWATINEPWVIMDGGYVHGVHAPGLERPDLAPVVAHNLLRAHAKAVQCFRASSTGRIGLVVNLEPKVAASSSQTDALAARQADAYMNRIFLDPIFRGAYPEELRHVFGVHWPAFQEEDFALIREPVDFVGVNYYTRGVTRSDESGVPVRAGYVTVPGSSYTDTSWEIHPESLASVLRWTQDRIGSLPIYVTENGAAFPEPTRVSGAVLEDPRRVEYYREHLRAAL
ncbi:MAG: glycoside hydrolase family 1 protein, partial [Candidatus Rokuibacteriota bacterium]